MRRARHPVPRAGGSSGIAAAVRAEDLAQRYRACTVLYVVATAAGLALLLSWSSHLAFVRLDRLALELLMGFIFLATSAAAAFVHLAASVVGRGRVDRTLAVATVTAWLVLSGMLAAWGTDWPASLRFHLSRSALQREATRVLGGGTLTRPTSVAGWVGLYHVTSVQVRSGSDGGRVAEFTVFEDNLLGREGILFSPDARQLGMRALGGDWYVFAVDP